MASFTQKIKGKYGVKTFQETKDTCDWIIKAMQKVYTEHVSVNLDFLFDIGKMTCSCKTMEEFIENAYGSSGYSLNRIIISACKDYMPDVFVIINHNNEMDISSESKVELEQIVCTLNKTNLYEDKIDSPISVTHIEHQDNSVTVNGDSNIIANNHSTVSDNTVTNNHNTVTEQQEKKESWLQGVFQGVLANGIWKLLGIIALAVIAYIVGKTV